MNGAVKHGGQNVPCQSKNSPYERFKKPFHLPKRQFQEWESFPLLFDHFFMRFVIFCWKSGLSRYSHFRTYPRVNALILYSLCTIQSLIHKRKIFQQGQIIMIALFVYTFLGVHRNHFKCNRKGAARRFHI